MAHISVESLDRKPLGEPAPSALASSSLARGQPLQARRTPLGLRHQEGTPGHPSSRPQQRDLPPGTGECRCFQGARVFGSRVLRGQSEGARPDLRAGDPQE